MKNKLLMALLLLAATGVQTVSAQKIVLYHVDGNRIEFSTAELDSIVFVEEGRVTGITIQGTYNPLFSSLNISDGPGLAPLIAFWGKPVRKVEFPTSDDMNYINSSEALTAKDWEMIGGDNVAISIKAGRTLMNEDEEGNAYAGKVYMTFKDMNFDATGLLPELVLKDDQVWPFKISPLRKNQESGFYEADVSVRKTDLEEVTLDINEENIYERMGEKSDSLLHSITKIAYSEQTDLNRKASDVWQWLRSLLSLDTGLGIEPCALKCSSYDDGGNEQTVYSPTDLIAAAFRLLVLKSFRDWWYKDTNEAFDGLGCWGPSLLATNDGNSFQNLSENVAAPTTLEKDGLTLRLTTKTLELVVPIARKHIVVTNVIQNSSAQLGDADCLAKLNEANNAETFNAVLDGTLRSINVDALASGYTYELAYSILDFEGNISTKKYYITIK